ncbi:MAG TPA: class I SAM-dependent methyltransferase [Chloroflexota bacterium]|nr:class I SAM-dependent methyltransferase [Chloroflexota bacterium]
MGDRSRIIDILSRNPEFAFRNGIPRHKSLLSQTQQQTADSFGYKWARRDTYESDAAMAMQREWILGRYGLTDGELEDLIDGRRFLDAGCGSGQSALLAFGSNLKDCEYLGVDISESVDVAAQRFHERGIPGDFIQASLLDLPPELGQFDFIFCEGVLHHTDSPELSVAHLAKRLGPGGIFMFYVYGKKAPAREFVDDYVRSQIAEMTNDEAWRTLEPLTELGMALGNLHAEIELSRPITVLGIPAGRIDVQRLFYWYFCKAFYREDWSLDEMNHVNFDWYRPANCHRQTPAEVQGWLDGNGLEVLRFNVALEGISVIARRRS